MSVVLKDGSNGGAVHNRLMSIVVTAPTGLVGSRVAKFLIQAGERPVLLVRDPARLDPKLRDLGEVRVADQTDGDAVVAATRGASALSWLTPLDSRAEDPIEDYRRKGEIAARATRENGIERVAFVSSERAGLRRGAGLIDGLGITEEILDATGASVVHLRCGFFISNFAQQLEGLRSGVMAGIAPADQPSPVVAPRDIGDVAAARLLDPSWSGRHLQGVNGLEGLTFEECAKVLSEATGREICYVRAPEDAFRACLISHGASEGYADAFVELARGPQGASSPRLRARSSAERLLHWARGPTRTCGPRSQAKVGLGAQLTSYRTFGVVNGKDGPPIVSYCLIRMSMTATKS